MNKFQLLRQAYIETLLIDKRRCHRNRLIEAFGVSPGCASIDLRTYAADNPHNVVYDANHNCYVRTREFIPAVDYAALRRFKLAAFAVPLTTPNMDTIAFSENKRASEGLQ